MLTWSDWKTEPRSNRYHYAVRFARQLPVFFVQPDSSDGQISFEPLEGHDITLVHAPADSSPEAAGRLAAALRERGAARPLVWLYNVYFNAVVPRLTPRFVVYHATEDYLSSPDSVKITQSDISHLALAALGQSDMVIAVSEGVADSHRRALKNMRPVHVLENGCDFAFWDGSGSSAYRPPPEGTKVVFFQGGINDRLDYDLLIELSDRLPDWEFWFCGKSVDAGEDWARLKARANVRDLGMLDSAGIAAIAQQALVGIIPFKDSDLMRRSLPLKAFEYVACGLPVVTMRIDALSGLPDLFETASGAAGFAEAILRLAPTRTDPVHLARRRDAASKRSYDARFQELEGHLELGLRNQARRRPALNVLMLYDDRSTHVGTIAEHLDAFRKYSSHRVHFLPATGASLEASIVGSGGDLSAYDAVMIHYSVRVSVEGHLSPSIERSVAAYRGPKILFIQDEYDRVETSRRYMERLGIDAVFTCVPLDSVDRVYPRARFPQVEFLPTLTGYVPEDPDIDLFVRPMADRTLRIAYRGRALPHQYGALGREKYTIGVEVRRLAEARNIPVDVEVEDSYRIYGLDWYNFIGSARATLGTESGSNVFDIDGSLSALAEKNRDMPFDAFARRYLTEHEGFVRMNQISPKIFEAIRLRTALVLFEGSYSGVVRPHEHYIPLAKDYSNIDDVFARLEDTAYLEALTERAYRDVVAPGAYSYRSFMEGVDAYLWRRAGGRRRAIVVSAPVATVYASGNIDTIVMQDASKAIPSDYVLDPRFTREDMQGSLAAIQKTAPAPTPSVAPFVAPFGITIRRDSPLVGPLQAVWRLLPRSVRTIIFSRLERAHRAQPRP